MAPIMRCPDGLPVLLGLLTISGWHGATATRVLVVGSTPSRVRIRALRRTRLAGPGRWLEPGEETLVPRDAIRIIGGPNEVDREVEEARQGAEVEKLRGGR